MPVRLTLRPAFAILTVVCLLPVSAPLALFASINVPLGLVIAAGGMALLGIVFVARTLARCYRWIELDGWTIRGRKLLSRRNVEWDVRSIVGINVVGMKGLGSPHPSPHPAYEVWFPDGVRLLLSRRQMSGMDRFLAALIAQIDVARVA